MWISHLLAQASGDLAVPNAVERLRNYYGVAGLFNIFIVLFVTLGPLKILGPFAKLTHNADEGLRSKFAIRAFLISTVTILVVAVIGQNLLQAWRIQLPALAIASGIMIFLSSLRGVRALYNPEPPEPPPAQPTMAMVFKPLVFPTILSPYGIGLTLVFMVIASTLDSNPGLILGLLVMIMLLNILAMLFVKPILGFINPAFLQILGLVLGIMQLVLGVQWMISGIEIETVILNRVLTG
jgi:multiple antibiotic resistance protein